MKLVTTHYQTAYPEINMTDMKPGEVGIMLKTFPNEVVFATHAGWFTNNDRVWLKDATRHYEYPVRLLQPGESITITRTV